MADTLLADLVAASRDVGEAGRRLDKTDRLAAFLGHLTLHEVEIGVSFLCGSLLQGRIGVGVAALREARSTPAAPAPGLTLAEVDRAFERVAATRGAGRPARSTPAALRCASPGSSATGRTRRRRRRTPSRRCGQSTGGRRGGTGHRLDILANND